MVLLGEASGLFNREGHILLHDYVSHMDKFLSHTHAFNSRFGQFLKNRRAWSPPDSLGASAVTRQEQNSVVMHSQTQRRQRKYGLLINESAGNFARLGKARVERLIRSTDAFHRAHIIYCAGKNLAHHARELAHSGVDAVGVYGGDGSARSVIEALNGYDVPVLPLPGGTMNRLCHRVHGHAHLKPILANLAGAQPLWLSGGRANEHLFLVASGFGPWMGFENIREIARRSGLVAGVKSLRSLRRDLFNGQLQMAGGFDKADLIVAAPGYVDAAFGLGKSRSVIGSNHGLEVGVARLQGPMTALKVGARVLTNSWQNLSNITVLRGEDLGLITHAAPVQSTALQEICGLVDGEVCSFGNQVHLTYQPCAALVLTTR